MKSVTPRFLLLGVFALLGFSGCVTHIKTDVTQNPPPAEKFSAFAHIEIARVVLPAPYAGQAANEKAVRKIQENIDLNTHAMLLRWRQSPPEGGGDRTLVVEPRIVEVKFINTTSRIWSFAFSGSSAVVLEAKFTDKQTGKLIAQPVFYARAEAVGGAFTFGVTDNLMLTRAAKRFTDYLEANYKDAVGGPSGAVAPK